MGKTLCKIWNNREVGWQAFYAAALAWAVHGGLPLWMILSGIACMAFWYAQENRKVVCFAIFLATVAFLAPGFRDNAAVAGVSGAIIGGGAD